MTLSSPYGLLRNFAPNSRGVVVSSLTVFILLSFLGQYLTVYTLLWVSVISMTFVLLSHDKNMKIVAHIWQIYIIINHFEQPSFEFYNHHSPRCSILNFY